MRQIDTKIQDRNYAKDPLTRAEIDAILAAGSVAAVMNTRHAVARERGWAESPPSREAFAEAVLVEPNLLRRPIVLAGGQVVVGHDPAGWARVLG